VLTLTDGKELGQIGTVEGWSDHPSDLSGFGSSTDGDGRGTARVTAKLAGGGELVLEFDLREAPDEWDEFRWFHREYLLDRLLAGDLPGRVLLRDGGAEREVTTFTASLGGVEYTRLDRPRAVEAEKERGEGGRAGGMESFRCDDTLPGCWWGGWAAWLAVGGVAAAAVFVVWRLRKRHPVSQGEQRRPDPPAG
jgi:hypothetical protein